MSSKPALHQSVPTSRPYRLYTIDHVPFGHFPRYRDGGPSLVTHAGWSTSTSSQTSMFGGTVRDTRHTVHARKVISNVPYVYETHPLDGQKFATDDEATQAQYEAGLLAYMVYEPGSGHGPDFYEANDAIVAAERAEVTV